MNKLKKTLSLLVFLSTLFPVSFALAETPVGWMDDFAAAKAAASEAGRPMLFMFTGSDWCGWCVRMHEEILDTPVFMDWAGENLVLVYVDFPRKDYRSKKLRAQNEELDSKYEVTGYPTLVLTDKEGKELRRLSYMQGGPKTFIRAIKRALN